MKWLWIAGILLLGPSALAEKSTGENAWQKIRALVDTWQFGPAQKAITDSGLSSVDAEYLLAEIDFLQGKYREAHTRMLALPAEARNSELGQVITKTAELTRDFKTVPTAQGNFIFSFPEGTTETMAELAGEVLEAARAALQKDFGQSGSGPLRVEIVLQAADLAKLSTLEEKAIETTGTIALCKYNKLMVVSPSATVFGYPWMDTLVHEYTHHVVSLLTADKTPIWLQEGLARFQQNRWKKEPGLELSEREGMLLSRALKKDRLIRFDDMSPSIAKLPSQEAAALAYAEVSTLVHFVHSKVGYAGLNHALAQIRQGVPAKRALAGAMDLSFDQLEAAWKKYLLGSLSQLTSSQAPKVGQIVWKKGQSDEGESEEEIAKGKSKTLSKSKKFLRLGGILRAAQHTKAAAVEYEKALAADKSNLRLLVKLARTYLQLEQPDKAARLLTSVSASALDEIGALGTLGVSLFGSGQSGKALPHLLAALETTPFDPQIRCTLAKVYDMAGDTDKAEREARACTRLTGH